MQPPLIDAILTLEKFPGKGGWTYAALPGLASDPHSHFGWVRVYGSIDDYEIDRYHLMPMGKGRLFLPVKAGIRKHIRKEAGDSVRVILFKDDRALEIPIEWTECLRDEPEAHLRFFKLDVSDQQTIIDRIYKHNTLNLQAKQMAKEIELLLSLGNKGQY